MGRVKRKVKVKIRQGARFVHKNDKTRVERDSLLTYRKKAPTKTYIPDNAATFKVKIRRKQ